MTNPIFCAVDRPDLEGTLALAQALAPHVGGIKLGLEFFTAQGPRGVEAVAALGLPIFLDLKLHDIPNTVAGAVREVAGLGVAMLTLHAAGGRAMLEAAEAAAAPRLTGHACSASPCSPASTRRPRRHRRRRPSRTTQALRLAELAVAAGLDGVVCSPLEIAGLRRALGPAPRIVVPGIRPEAGGDDQKRVMGPAEALALGADILVIGRPITRAPVPAEAAAAIAPAAAYRCLRWPSRVKICGLTEPARVAAGGPARRRLSGLRLLSAFAALRRPGAGARARGRGSRGQPRAWALVVDAADAEIEALLQAVPLDLLQLHGYETPERVAEDRPALRLPGDQGAAGRRRRPTSQHCRPTPRPPT